MLEDKIREIFTLWATYGIYSTELLFRIVMGPALKNRSRADPEPWISISSQVRAWALHKSSIPSLGFSQDFEPDPSKNEWAWNILEY